MAAVKVGNLTKRGQGYPYTWQDRVFSLYSNKLDYATSAGVVKGFFPINTESTVEALQPADAPEKKENCFKVTSGGKDLFITALSKFERLAWIDAITKEIAGTVVLSAEELLAQAEEMERQAREQEEADRLEAEEVDRLRLVNEEKSRLEAEVAAKELEKLKIAEAEQARKNAPHTAVHNPHAAQKKIDSESKYADRFVWIEHDTDCFHWAKTATEGPTSKNIDIKVHIARCQAGNLSDSEPNFSLILKEGSDAPGFSKGLMGSVKAGRIDVILKGSENTALVAEFVAAINAIISK